MAAQAMDQVIIAAEQAEQASASTSGHGVPLKKRKVESSDSDNNNDATYQEGPAPRRKRCAGKGGRSRSSSTRASNHVITEQKRRDRINDSFAALRELVPHDENENKASFLGTVVEYVASMQAIVRSLTGGAFPEAAAAGFLLPATPCNSLPRGGGGVGGHQGAAKELREVLSQDQRGLAEHAANLVNLRGRSPSPTFAQPPSSPAVEEPQRSTSGREGEETPPEATQPLRVAPRRPAARASSAFGAVPADALSSSPPTPTHASGVAKGSSPPIPSSSLPMGMGMGALPMGMGMGALPMMGMMGMGALPMGMGMGMLGMLPFLGHHHHAVSTEAPATVQH